MKKIIRTCLLMVAFSANAASVGGLAPTNGWYWSLEEPGTGMNLSIQYGSITDDGFLFASWFVYDGNGDNQWFIMTGPYKPSSWEEWKATGTIGTYDGPMNKISGGQEPGGAWQANQSAPSVYGDVHVDFYGRYVDLTVDGGTMRYQTADWANGLDDEGADLYKDSLLDGSWSIKGKYITTGGTNHFSIDCVNAPQVLFEPASDEPTLGNPNIPPSLDLSPYNLGWVAEETKYHMGPDITIGAGSDATMGECYKEDSELGTHQFLYVRDKDTGDEYILWWVDQFGGEGYELSQQANPSDFPVFKIFYLDRDHAVAIAIASQNQFLGLGHPEPDLSDEFLKQSYFFFTRNNQGESEVLRREREGTLDDDVAFKDLRIWK
ncbi:MAG: hypothetical protein ACWA5R_04330 [bacterium]